MGTALGAVVTAEAAAVASSTSGRGVLIVDPGFGLRADPICEIECSGLERAKKWLYDFLGIKEVSPPSADSQITTEPAAKFPLPKELAWIYDVASGHGWDEHARSLGYTKAEYAQHILDTVERAQENGDVRYRARDGATAYWYDGTLVVHNPNDPDKGTAYEPDAGKKAFNTFGEGPPPINPD